MVKMANRYGVKEFGDASQLHAQQQALPDLAPEQVMIRVISSSVNPIDIKTRQGLGYVAAQKAPGAFLPLGYDVYGEVIAVAEESSSFAVGDEVIGMVGFAQHPGCYADYVIADHHELVKVDTQQQPDIAGLCLAGLTAKQALDRFEDKSKPLFIVAPTGGVGHLAVQLAQLQGREVIAVSRRPEHELLNSLGVKAITYDSFWQQQQQGDLLDLIGDKIAIQCLSALQAGSQVITIPSNTSAAVCERAAALGIDCQGMLVQSNQDDLKYLYHAYQTGKIKVMVSHYFALDELQRAHQCVESGAHYAKVILKA